MPKNDRRWFAMICILAVLLISLIGAFTVKNFIDGIYSEAMSTIEDQINISCNQVSIFLSEKLGAANVLAQEAARYIKDEDDTAGFQSVAEHLIPFYQTNVFSAIGIAGKSGILYAGKGLTYDVSENADYQKALLTPIPFVSQPTYSRNNGKDIVVVFAPVILDGKIVATIAGSLQIEELENKLIYDFYHGQGYCHIISNDGTVIVHSTNPNSDFTLQNLFDKIAEQYSGQAEGQQILKKIKQDFTTKERQIVSLRFNDGNKIIGYQSVPGYIDWNIVCVVLNDKVWQHSLPLISQAIGLTIGCMLVLLAAVLALGLMRKNARRRLERLAYCDEVTGGRNLNYFKLYAPILLKKNADIPYILLRFDIDRFKYFNDSFGHEMGDRLLKEIYTILTQVCPEADGSLAARLHGDEFVVLTKDNGSDDPAKAVWSALGSACANLHLSYTFTIAMGAYRPENREEPLDILIDKAHLAQKQYKANRHQQSYIYYDSYMDAINLDASIEAVMEQALRDEEFEVYFQPKISLETEKVVGSEALIRWNSKKLGFLSPADFIPIFEKNGFIRKIDFYVLDFVCKNIRRGMDAGAPLLNVSINQSRLHCYDPDYLEKLQAVIKKYNVPPNFIELEITESILLDDMEMVAKVIQSLRALHFEVSIDDFGSGYTSLSFLRNVDVDVIKMDKSLLDDIETTPKKLAMLHYLTEMSHAFGVKVVCEGVETEQQVKRIRSLGCDIAQGYYYARPMPMLEFEQYFKAHT